MDLETVDCPICGQDDSRPILRTWDLNLPGPGEFQLVGCGGCGLVYLSPRPTSAELARHYPARYWVPPPAAGQQPHLDAGTRRALAYLEREDPAGRVLDVGCGVGNAVAVMRERGLDAVGLEPYEQPCQLARERYGLDAICAPLRESGLPEASFDAVTFLDVLEHVADPVGDLQEAHRLLRPGGSVVIKVPNLAAWQARLFGRWWYCLDAPRHLFHFRAATLRRALAAAGFSQVDCRAVPTRVGALAFEAGTVLWLRSLARRRRGLPPTPEESQPVADAVGGQVYAVVPSYGKRAFRWFLRNVLYLPLAVENLVGRSVELLAIGRR